MKTKRAIFVSMILVISILCLAFMNVNYDKLSRYPYKNEENNRLIREHLNDQEIEYIIEYSIAPATFIAYIQEDGFNIYHAAEYRELNKLLWDETPAAIVRMVEKTRNYMDVITLANYLVYYKFDELSYWIDHGDSYNSNSILVTNAGNPNAYVDDIHTVSIRKPYNLQQINDNIPTLYDKYIQVDAALQTPIQNLCNAIQTDLSSFNSCGGLFVSEGYISYADQDKRYKDAIQQYGENAGKVEFMPGHSEHQLGLAVDFCLRGLANSEFDKTEQYKWLLENAYLYGFVQSYKVENAYLTNKSEQSYHFRYVGDELARYLHDNNLSLGEVIAN